MFNPLPVSKIATRPTAGSKQERAIKKAAASVMEPVESAARAARPAPAQPAVRAAAKTYTGAYSGALNNLSEAEQRVHDVAARRSSDADQYQAYVLGKQGSIASAAQAADDKALADTGRVQAQTTAAQLAVQQGLQTSRAANGVAGAVPAQQLSGVSDQQLRTQALLGAARSQQADSANTNRGKAGFLAAAANAALLANKRAIAGDEFQQADAIGREKTGILVQKTEGARADKNAAAAAAADVARAQIAADQSAADRSSREAIASNSAATQADIANARINAAASEGVANRSTRVRTAEISAQGGSLGGYVKPAELRRRRTAVSTVESQYDKGSARARTVSEGSKALGKPLTPALIRHALDRDFPKMPKEVRERIVAETFKREPGRAPKGSAKKRYDTLLKQIRSGTR